MPKLPRISSGKLLAALMRADFYIHHQTGSHIHLRHNLKSYLRVVVPKRSKDLAPKTIKSIIIQAGFTIEEFINLL